VTTAGYVAASAATISVGCLGRRFVGRLRRAREDELLAATELSDPRSRAETWIDDKTPALLLVVGSISLLVAVVAGLLALVT
jgi:hypothetical protein